MKNTPSPQKNSFLFLTNWQGSPLPVSFSMKLQSSQAQREKRGEELKVTELLIKLSKESFAVVFFSEIQFPLSHRPNNIIKDNTVAMKPNALASNDDNLP